MSPGGAINKDLREEVKQGRFREDLFYRLSIPSVALPPLRERKEDIPLLAKQFLREFSKKMEKSIAAIDPEVKTLFMDYDWPGNIRQLKNVIEASVVMARSDRLTWGDLILTGFQRPVEDGLGQATNRETMILWENKKRLIMETLAKCNWVQKDAAEILGISGWVISYKIKKSGISIPRRSALKDGRNSLEGFNDAPVSVLDHFRISNGKNGDVLLPRWAGPGPERV